MTRNLSGPVILTHCIAPRHTAYLVILLADVEDIGTLLAFGAADMAAQHSTFLLGIGITTARCRVFAEKWFIYLFFELL